MIDKEVLAKYIQKDYELDEAMVICHMLQCYEDNSSNGFGAYPEVAEAAKTVLDYYLTAEDFIEAFPESIEQEEEPIQAIDIMGNSVELSKEAILELYELAK